MAEFGPFDAVSDVAHGLYLNGFALRAVEACEQWARLTEAAGDHETTRYLRYIEAMPLQELGRAAEALEVAEALLVRYGGDEFLVLPDGGRDAAVSLAERVCVAVAQHPWSEVSDALRVTVSVGVGPTDRAATDPWAAADAALQQAKRTGRNRVACYRAM